MPSYSSLDDIRQSDKCRATLHWKTLDKVINAELLFTEFLLEHNLPFEAASHAGQLFHVMFPDSEIVKKYGNQNSCSKFVPSPALLRNAKHAASTYNNTAHTSNNNWYVVYFCLKHYNIIL